jgi:DNA-binding phage protein
MPLTKDFRETVKARADRDPAFRAGLYQEAVQAMLDGDFATGRLLLRDFINATIGFPTLAERLGVHDKSLMRMFGAAGNPHAENLLAVLHALKDECRLSLRVEAKPVRRRQAVVRHTDGTPAPM